MNSSLTITGGFKAGLVSGSWPFARLAVSARSLLLSAGPFGSFEFEPGQIVKLEPHGRIPILGRGIRIVHVRPDYPTKLVFWCFQNPERLIERIYRLGFRPSGSTSTLPPREGMPMRWTFVLAVIVVWNALFFLDQGLPANNPKSPGLLVITAVAFMVIVSFALPRSTRLQSLALKPGRAIGEIRPLLSLIQLVCGGLFLMMTLVLLIGWPEWRNHS